MKVFVQVEKQFLYIPFRYPIELQLQQSSRVKGLIIVFIKNAATVEGINWICTSSSNRFPDNEVISAIFNRLHIDLLSDADSKL